MSKRLVAVMALSLVAQNAFASRAHNLITGSGDAGSILAGSGNGGSFYTDDNYNMFYNPSYVNDYKNWATIEKSNATGAAPGTTAEGGFVANMMNMNVGVYLNRVAAITGAGGSTQTSVNNYRPIDLIVGGDMGVKWGLGLTYGSVQSSGATLANGSDLTLRAGVQFMDLDPFVFFKVVGKDNVAAGENKYKDMGIGLRYHWGEWTPYAAVRIAKFEAVGATLQPKNTNWGLGISRNTKLADSVKFNYAFSYWTQKVSDNATPNTRMILPIDMSVEGDAATWLTLRAGLQYRLMDRISGNATTAGTQADATAGRIGAVFHVAKVDFEWAVGNNGTAGAEGNLDTQAFDVTNSFFTAANLTYHW